MMKEIEKARAFIQREFPHLDKNYATNLNVADKAILHSLVQAVIREYVFEHEWSHDGRMVIVSVSSGKLLIPIAKTYILGHIDMADSMLFIDEEGEQHTIDTTSHCLDLFFKDEAIPVFYQEVLNSVSNYALALTIAEDRKQGLETMNNDSLTYAETLQSPLTFFEQWVIQGHTIHPCARTRIGLSPDEITRYAPEWEGEPEVQPVAVHKSVCRMTSINGESTKSVLFTDYPELEKAFHDQCQKHGRSPGDYEIIPIHPWQYEHTVPAYYQAALEDKTLFPIEGCSISAAALISFRTLAPLSSRANHHIKTAVNVQMTSAVRTVSAASTKNGPTISRLLQEIFAKDETLSHSLSMMSDIVGIHYEPEEMKDRHFLQKNMAAILRENPEKDLGKDEIAIPAAALIAESPVTGKLIAEEMAEKHSSVRAFLRHYAKAVLPGVLTLMTKYGISMEAHLQNCVVICKNGIPERAVLRDVGGIRIMHARLDRFFEKQPIDHSTNLLTEDREELLNVFSHALLHNHFGEIIVALARRSSVKESDLWSEVETVMKETYDQLKQDNRIREDAEADLEALLTRPATMKALVKMRLSDQFTDYIYVDVPNPFSYRKEVPKA